MAVSDETCTRTSGNTRLVAAAHIPRGCQHGPVPELTLNIIRDTDACNVGQEVKVSSMFKYFTHKKKHVWLF